ncbi:hypothetical protein [Mucilaginibacter antarcticus]|uniref:hypothetical protein n=1 Tax=Mucilaginibacter antarcticus TaxID=1855725 RepID=UPI0036356D5D
MNVTNNNINTMPVKGTITPKVSAEDANGTYIIRAAYTDKGAGSIPKQTSTTTIFLKNPTVLAATATIQKSVTTKVGGLDGVTYIIPRKDGYIGFKSLTLPA